MSVDEILVCCATKTDILKVSGGQYHFSNIRYAPSLLVNLRFAEPVPPQGPKLTVDDGSMARFYSGV